MYQNLLLITGNTCKRMKSLPSQSLQYEMGKEFGVRKTKQNKEKTWPTCVATLTRRVTAGTVGSALQ